MIWRERERESKWKRECEGRNNTKIMYKRAIVNVHLCTVTIALMYLCTILHLGCFFFKNV